MKYASTIEINGIEKIVQILPLELVPGFDPENPPQANTYGVPDEVELGWVKSGGAFVAPPAPASPAVPQSVQALQGLLAIDFFNLATEFDAWAKSPERAFAERAFIDKAQTWKRNDPTVLAAAEALGITSEQLDQMFIKAATLG